MVYSTIIIFLLSVSLALAYNFNPPTGATSQVTCNKGKTTTYHRIGEKYYFLGKTKVNWFESAHLCRQIGGDLAQIESAREMEAVSNALKKEHFESEYFWISGNDLVQTHKFASITNGLPLEFTDWSTGQPDNPGKEQCLHLWLRNNAFRMNNLMCTEKAYYLCQRQEYSHCWDG